MKSETLMLTITLALAIALVGGLVVVPAIEQHADAANSISDARNKGQQGFVKSGGQGGSGGGNPGPPG